MGVMTGKNASLPVSPVYNPHKKHIYKHVYYKSRPERPPPVCHPPEQYPRQYRAYRLKLRLAQV